MITLKQAVEIANNQEKNEKYMVISKRCYELSDKWCFSFAYKMDNGDIPTAGYNLIVYKKTGETKRIFLPSGEGFALMHEKDQYGKNIDISEYIKELEK